MGEHEDSNEWWTYYREGEAANDNNHRVIRKGLGVILNNPYHPYSREWRAWTAGYVNRDLVNDG